MTVVYELRTEESRLSIGWAVTDIVSVRPSVITIFYFKNTQVYFQRSTGLMPDLELPLIFFAAVFVVDSDSQFIMYIARVFFECAFFHATLQ